MIFIGITVVPCGVSRNSNGLFIWSPEASRLTSDVRGPQYLRHDTKKAVEEPATRGVRTFCLTLDPKADDYVARIFGTKGYRSWTTSAACRSGFRCCTRDLQDNIRPEHGDLLAR